MAAAVNGNHEFDVHFGSSFAPPPGQEPEAFFSFRYAQKPASLDSSLPGTLSGNPTTPGAFYASFPSTQTGGAKPDSEHWFSGSVVEAKEVECVLVWDEARQSYSLERLDGAAKLSHDRLPKGATHHIHASLPVGSPRIPATTARRPVPITAGDQDTVSSDSSSDGELVVPSLPPKHLRKPASDRARAAVGALLAGGGTDSSTSGEDRGRPPARRPPPGHKAADEVEDFGDVALVVPPAGSSAKGKETEPVPAAVPSPLLLPQKRYASPAPTPFAFPAPVPPPAQPTPVTRPQISLSPRQSPRIPSAPPQAIQRPTPPKPPARAPPPKPAPPVAASKRPAPPPAAAVPPAARPRPSAASKRPPLPTTTTGSRPRRSSVALKSMPASLPAARPASSGSDDDSDDDDSSNEEDEEEDDSGPEGYLAVPGSVLSHSARGAGGTTGGGSAVATTEDDDAEGDDESEESMEELESVINAGLSKPPRRSGGAGVGVGQVAGKGLPRPAAASKMPQQGRVASKGPAGRVASKGPGQGGRVASKGPAPGRVASKGPARSGQPPPPAQGGGKGRARGPDVDAAQARRAADIPDSESEED